MFNKIAEGRFNLLEKKMEENNLDAVLVYGRGMVTHYGYFYYFANYYPILRPGFMIKIKGQDPIAFYTTRADYYLAKERGTIDDVRYAGIGDVVDSKNGVLNQISELINESNPENVGICGLDTIMTFNESEHFKETLKGNVTDCTLLIQEMKALKSKDEMDQTRHTFKLAEQSFSTYKQHTAAGENKSAVAAEADKVAREHGSISTLMFVEDGPYFLRKPVPEPLKENGLVTAYVEIVGPNGYWVEKAGLVAIGELSEEEKEIGEA